MKTIAKLITIAALLFSVGAVTHAQTFSLSANLITGSLTITNDTTRALNIDFPVTRAMEVAIQTEVQGEDALLDGTNIVFLFHKSLDNVNWGSPFSITNEATGTTRNTQVDNVDIGAVGFLRLVSIKNNEATHDITNTVVRYAIKPGN